MNDNERVGRDRNRYRGRDREQEPTHRLKHSVGETIIRHVNETTKVAITATTMQRRRQS